MCTWLVFERLNHVLLIFILIYIFKIDLWVFVNFFHFEVAEKNLDIYCFSPFLFLFDFTSRELFESAREEKEEIKLKEGVFMILFGRLKYSFSPPNKVYPSLKLKQRIEIELFLNSSLIIIFVFVRIREMSSWSNIFLVCNLTLWVIFFFQKTTLSGSESFIKYLKLIGRSLLSINGFLKKIDEIEYQQQGEKIQLRS